MFKVSPSALPLTVGHESVIVEVILREVQCLFIDAGTLWRLCNIYCQL